MTWRPMAHDIETERLILRLRDERDAEWYRELVAERGQETPTLEEATARLVRTRDQAIETGIGCLTITRRAEGDAIGYCALIVGRCSLDEPEIAYELLRRFHGHGYATEAARALVAAAADTDRKRSGPRSAPGTRRRCGSWRRSASGAITRPRTRPARSSTSSATCSWPQYTA